MYLKKMRSFLQIIQLLIFEIMKLMRVYCTYHTFQFPNMFFLDNFYLHETFHEFLFYYIYSTLATDQVDMDNSKNRKSSVNRIQTRIFQISSWFLIYPSSFIIFNATIKISVNRKLHQICYLWIGTFPVTYRTSNAPIL